MQNFAAVLKEEIRRLARKEIRAQVSAMKRAVGQYRHDIARIKRQVAACQRQLARVSAGGERAEKESASAGEAATAESLFVALRTGPAKAARTVGRRIRPTDRGLGADHLSVGAGEVASAEISIRRFGRAAIDQAAGRSGPLGCKALGFSSLRRKSNESASIAFTHRPQSATLLNRHGLCCR